MSNRRKLRKDKAAQMSFASTQREIRDLLDPYSERTSVPHPGSDQVIIEPGKIIDNLRDRMDRYAIDPLLDAAVEDFISADEVQFLARLSALPVLVHATALQAAKLVHWELPEQMAAYPISPEFDLVKQTGMSFTPVQLETGRKIFNQATANPGAAEDYQSNDELDDLSPGDQAGVFMVVLVCYLIKIAYAAQNRQQM
jgi:hypothetical protein